MPLLAWAASLRPRPHMGVSQCRVPNPSDNVAPCRWCYRFFAGLPRELGRHRWPSHAMLGTAHATVSYSVHSVSDSFGLMVVCARFRLRTASSADDAWAKAGRFTAILCALVRPATGVRFCRWRERERGTETERATACKAAASTGTAARTRSRHGKALSRPSDATRSWSPSAPPPATYVNRRHIFFPLPSSPETKRARFLLPPFSNSIHTQLLAGNPTDE